MIWSLDQDSSSNTSGNDFLGIGVTNGVAATDAEKIRTLQASAQAVANNRNSCYWSFCGQECTVGFIPETYAKGQVTGISLDTTCSGDDVQTLCCAPGTNTGTCDWYGWRGVGMPCVTGYCPEGSDLIAINTPPTATDPSSYSDKTFVASQTASPQTSTSKIARETGGAHARMHPHGHGHRKWHY
ncbi:hypothetical protein CBS147333_3644 [Penicillium roqueforti]|nr:hypothetical protein CBS147372_9129 [Penicillium roqueforti]KAI2710719.1 hypothetical protein CBS147354_8559 [Penicillium roqueforti]KAI3112670.1 hypothetical protein CBS147333_3644 [Penicillium roqueforti]KAI3128707.1 hypothetical protein CBS147326_6732 [Penicillium roqueforti]KAI3149799.1 hypothetical protein CBS147317_7785 [Penicillium roqueforti]